MTEAVTAATRMGMSASAAEYVRRALTGDEAAFEWIVETFSRDMAQVRFVVCGDPALAEEALAAAWPLAWHRLASLRETDRLARYIAGFDSNELARATGLSPSGTRARLARLLERMRTELSDV